MSTIEKKLTAAGALARLVRGTAQQTVNAAKAVPPAKRLHQLAPGKATPLWLLGHIANTADYVGCLCGFGEATGLFPDAWRKRFTPPPFGGAPITANAADYPEWDEILAVYSKVIAVLESKIGALTDEELLGPPRGQMPPPLLKMVTSLQDVASLSVLHDSHHRGQLALLGNAPE